MIQILAFLTLFSIDPFVLKPDSLQGALSLRTPYADGARLLDYEVSAGCWYSHFQFECLFERENDSLYYGYLIRGEHEFKPINLEYSTREHEAAGINRQSIIAGRKFHEVGFGVGVAARNYSSPSVCCSFSIPLPGGGVTYTTDFTRRVQVWEAESWIDFPGGEHFTPFVLGRYYQDGNNQNYQMKGGVKWMWW